MNRDPAFAGVAAGFIPNDVTRHTMTILVHTHWVALAMAAVAATTDHRSGTIPNWLTLPPLFLGPAVFFYVHGVPGLLSSLAGLIVCGLIPALLYWKDAIGGGDVKLFAALGAVVGLEMGLEAQLISYIAAWLYSLVRLGIDRKLGTSLRSSLFLLLNPLLPKSRRREIKRELLTSVRLGGAILVGTAITVLLRHPDLWSGWWS